MSELLVDISAIESTSGVGARVEGKVECNSNRWRALAERESLGQLGRYRSK